MKNYAITKIKKMLSNFIYYIHYSSSKKQYPQNNYNIAMITDDNYVMPTVVAITSLIKNKKKLSSYTIHILTTNLQKKNEELLKQLSTNDINIQLHNCSQLLEKYKNIDINRHVTPNAMFKFFLPDIFSNCKKILYLDSDIIIQKDLSELFNIPLDTYYAAVIKDILSVRNRRHMDKVGIKNKYYFNSGVMLLNLDLMRKDNIVNKLIDFRLSRKQHFMDQDAFNGVIGHNVKYISYKYNFLNFYLTVMDKQSLSEFFDENLSIYKKDNDIYKNCVIVHLGGKEKPWTYDLGYLSKIYKKYYNQTFYRKKKLKLTKLQICNIRNKNQGKNMIEGNI